MDAAVKPVTPLVNVLRASMRAEQNPLCKALDEVLGQCDLQHVEKCIQMACEALKQGTPDAHESSVDALALELAKVSLKQLCNSTNAAERAAAHLFQGMLFSGVYELSAVLEDIVYPMYLDPEDIRASVLE